MSRGYDDDCDGEDSNFIYLWESIVKRAMEGRRGQEVLREIEAALLAMPVKRLIAHSFAEAGEVCALGALACSRGITMDYLEKVSRECDGEYSDQYTDRAKAMLKITESVAREVQHENDGRNWGVKETPEERYERMLEWVRSNIKKEKVAGGKP